MMMSRITASTKRVALLLGLAFSLPGAAHADLGYAIVPNATIYSGDVITSGSVTSVEVTNPNLAAGYAEDMKQVVGKVAKRTLVAGRTIPVMALRDPYTVRRGAPVRITYTVGRMQISARGEPLNDAMAGESIRVRNSDTGVTVDGTVMKDGSIEVREQ
jgi:flagellar basal body P-ring formation protein FlgA